MRMHAPDFWCRAIERCDHAGTDFVDILPTDDNFCVDCAYQIGLNSASRSSFTVSVYRGDEGGEWVDAYRSEYTVPRRHGL